MPFIIHKKRGKKKRKAKGKKKKKPVLCVNFVFAYNSTILTGYDNETSNIAKKNYMYNSY